MIFVIMGMEVHPFDRLALAIDDLARSQDTGEDFLVQLGACTYEPKHARFERYFTFGEICENIRASNVVITHAGAGSTLVCIQQGKHPIIVPRRASLGEHVDDHQVSFAERLSQEGFATAIHEMGELSSTIRSVRSKTLHPAALRGAAELTSWLEEFWRTLEKTKAS